MAGNLISKRFSLSAELNDIPRYDCGGLSKDVNVYSALIQTFKISIIFARPGVNSSCSE